MKIQKMLICLLSAIIITVNILEGEKLISDAEVNILIDESQKGSSFLVIIQCATIDSIKKGVLKIETKDRSNQTIQNIVLWEGDINPPFKKEFKHQVFLRKGEKLRLSADFKFVDRCGTALGTGKSIVMHNTPKGIITLIGGGVSFYDLDKLEVWKEAYAKGYKGLSIEQISERDPKLGKRLEAFNTEPGILGPGSADPNVNQKRIKERELWKEVWEKGYKGLTIEEILKRDPEMGKKIQEFYNLGPGETMPKVNHSKFSPNYVDSSKYYNKTLNPNDYVDSTKFDRATPGQSGDVKKHEYRPDGNREVIYPRVKEKKQAR